MEGDLFALPLLKDPNTLLDKIVWVLLSTGEEVAANDTLRNMPVGIEVEVLYLGIHFRSLSIWPSNNHAMALHDPLPFDRLELESRDIDHDVAPSRR